MLVRSVAGSSSPAILKVERALGTRLIDMLRPDVCHATFTYLVSNLSFMFIYFGRPVVISHNWVFKCDLYKEENRKNNGFFSLQLWMWCSMKMCWATTGLDRFPVHVRGDWERAFSFDTMSRIFECFRMRFRALPNVLNWLNKAKKIILIPKCRKKLSLLVD